jgi:putative ABC transport system permease protein
MFGTRGHKILRDIWTRKARTAMVSISIFIGVLGVVTLTSAGDLLIAKIQKDLVEDKIAMAYVFVELDEDVEPEDLDNDAILETLRAYPGVTIVQGWAWDRMYWRKPDETGFIEGDVRSYTEPFDAMPIEPVTLVTGRYPEPGQREVIVERRMADRYGLKAGDPIVIRILSQLSGTPGAATDIPEETWTVTGIVFHPYLGDSNRRSLYTHFEDMAYIASNTSYFRRFQVRFTDFPTADASADDFESYINTNTPFKVNGINLDNPANNEYIQEMQDWTNTLRTLAIIAMLVASFLVVTVITTIVIEQKRQIGIMKSLGATRFDNFLMYAGIAVLYGVIGMVPGVLLGIPAGYYLAEQVAPLMNVLLEGFTLSVTGVTVGAVMGVVMPFLAAILPVILGTRVTIREAVTDLGISARYGYGPVARLIHALPFPMAVRQALANIYQKRGRLAMTGITLTLAAGTFIGVSAVFISLDNTLENIFNTFNTHMTIIPLAPEDYDYAEVGTLIEQTVGGLNGVYPMSDTGLDIVLAEAANPGEEDTVRWTWTSGFDPHTDSVQLDLDAGRGWLDDPERDGIVLTRSLADDIGKGVGDVITVRYEDTTRDLEIIGIDRFPFPNAFVRWQTLAALTGEDAPEGYELRFADDGISGADVDRKIGDIREQLLRNGIVAWYGNTRANEEENASVIRTAGLVFNIASLVMAAVGAIGLLTMLFISVFERQREIGVMRSVGAGSRAIAGQFLTEGLMVGSIAWLLGVPLSYGVGHLLMQMLPVGDMGFNYPLIAPIAGLGGMLAVATLASLWPSLAASRKTVSDILRYQ